MLSSGAESSRATLSRPANIDGTGYILQILQLYGVDRDTKQLKHRWADVVGRDSDLLDYVGIEVGGVTWTTWMTEIIDLIVNNGDVQKCQRDAVYKRIRMLEFALPRLIPPGTEVLTQTLPPRIMRTHLPITYLPKSFWENKCKIIYVARSAKDVVVSYYYFRLANNLHSHPGTFAQHFEDFMAGNVSFGSWYEHVKGWWSKRNELRLLYVFYEDMKEDLEREIRKLLTFLEKDMDEEVLKKIVHHASFEVMKDNPMANFKTHEAFDHNASPFMRKGITGDWKNHFTVAQNQRFNEDYAEKMEGSLLPFRMEH